MFTVVPGVEKFPIYFPMLAVVLFCLVVLNIYLHCGYYFDFLEFVLPRFMINSSKFHNIHHEKMRIHFAEFLTLWDFIIGTGVTHYNTELSKNYQLKDSRDVAHHSR